MGTANRRGEVGGGLEEGLRRVGGGLEEGWKRIGRGPDECWCWRCAADMDAAEEDAEVDETKEVEGRKESRKEWLLGA